MSCGVGQRCGSDPALLWLWRRPAAVALIQPLAWEPAYAVSVGLKKKNCITSVLKMNQKYLEEKSFKYIIRENIYGVPIVAQH